MAAKSAVVVTDAVSVLCPTCGEPQINANGSGSWTLEDYLSTPALPCGACGQQMRLTAAKAAFDRFRRR